MRIFLHVGAHRTATTALQRMMGQSGPALQEAGVAYWGPKRTRGGLLRGLLGTTDAARAVDVTRAQKRLRLHTAKAADIGAGAVWLSDENMLGQLRYVTEETRLYPSAGARVAHIAEGFAGHPVTVALAIRCYDAWWASAVAFRLLKGGPLPTSAYCDRLVTQPRRWRHVIADLAQAMPDARIVVWSYERWGGQPAAAVRRLIGGDLDLAGPQGYPNRIAPPHEIGAYLEACGLDPQLAQTQADRFMPFDAHQRRVLRAQYAEDLAWLSAGAGGLADYLDTPEGMVPGLTDQQKGPSDDPRHRQARPRRLA